IARRRSDPSQRTYCSCSVHFSCKPARNVGSQPGLTSSRRARDYRGIGRGGGVVSEETGSISICHRRRIERNFTPETFRQRIAEILLHTKYEETDSEKLAREVDLSPARDNALVPDQKERSDDALAV